jgi:putative ABC transport system substrate-binding protein
MRRRDFIKTIAGSAAAWPLAARAQGDGGRRIGALLGYAESDQSAQSRFAAFKQELAARGWTDGVNLRIDARWTGGDVTRAAASAKELVAKQPEVILANTTPVTAAVQHETKTIPIVFVVVSDPIGSGFVKSLQSPGANITGFTNVEASLVEKWAELLKEIAPGTKRVAVMFNPQTASFAQYYLQPLEAAASALGVQAQGSPVLSEAEIEKVIAGLGDDPGSGLIMMTDGFMFVHRKAVIDLTARYKVPATYYFQEAVKEGGLISYGVNNTDLFRSAAIYVDRILRGAKPAELAVQGPTKYELFVNRTTAKTLGLTVPQTILATADDIVE